MSTLLRQLANRVTLAGGPQRRDLLNKRAEEVRTRGCNGLHRCTIDVVVLDLGGREPANQMLPDEGLHGLARKHQLVPQFGVRPPLTELGHRKRQLARRLIQAQIVDGGRGTNRRSIDPEPSLGLRENQEVGMGEIGQRCRRLFNRGSFWGTRVNYDAASSLSSLTERICQPSTKACSYQQLATQRHG